MLGPAGDYHAICRHLRSIRQRLLCTAGTGRHGPGSKPHAGPAPKHPRLHENQRDHPMKRFLIGLTLAALWLAPWTEAAQNLLVVPAQNANKAGVTPSLDEASLPVVDRIVAVVNNNVITYSELNDRTNLIAYQLARQGVTLPERHILMRQVLEKMVIDAVQM